MSEEKAPEEPPPAPNVDGTFEISVSPDKFRAGLAVVLPKGQGRAVTADDVLKKSTEMGLKNVDGTAVSAYLADGNFVQPLTVAEGKSPVDGQDGRVDYLYLEKGGQAEDSHGSVDIRNISAFKFAARGEQIVKIHPPVEGQDGATVFGEPIPYTPGKNPAPSAGKNIEISADGTVYTATEAGCVVTAGETISVEKLLKTDGDVDFNVGNIDFDGVVMIGGAVMEGFKVKATGDVFADLVSQGTVDAGGSVTITKGILGAAGTHVKARGDVRAKFIENAAVDAGGHVMISESIMHSTVTAVGHVIVRGGKHCNIVGGHICSAGNVEAHTLGTEVATQTLIEIGFDPDLRRRLTQMESELPHQTENLEKLKLGLLALNKQKDRDGGLPPDKEHLRNKLAESCEVLKKQVEDMKKVREDLQQHLQTAKPGTVSAKGDLMPGVQVTILRETHKISKRTPSTTVYLDREKKRIAFTSFKETEL